MNNEDQNFSNSQATEEITSQQITVNKKNNKSIPVHIKEALYEQKTEISTVSLEKKDTYRSIIELPEYQPFITLDFFKIATFIIALMIIVTGMAYQFYTLNPEAYIMSSLLMVFDVIFLFYLYKANKERLQHQAINELVLNFAKKHRDFKITNREYLTFLLEHSNNYLIVKEAIYQEINKLSTKGYSLEKFLKHNLHTTLKDDFSTMEKEVIEHIKNKLFEETYKH